MCSSYTSSANTLTAMMKWACSPAYSFVRIVAYAAKHEARFMKLLTEQTEDGSKRRNAAKNQVIRVGFYLVSYTWYLLTFIKFCKKTKRLYLYSMQLL